MEMWAMDDSYGERGAKRIGEWVTAVIGAATCLIVPAMFLQAGGEFPLPALYLLEIAVVGLLVVYFVFIRHQVSERWGIVPWIAAGIMLAFVILGGFTIGLYLIPALIAFAALGVLIDWEAGGLSIARNLGLLIVAGVAQGVVMIGATLLV